MENSKKQTVDDLFVFATKNDEVVNDITNILSEKHSTMEIMRLDSRLLDDLKKDENNDDKYKPITVDEFVSNEENKDIAETKALTLWNMLTNNSDYGEAIGRIFTKSEIVTRTTLTNKTLGELLELFYLFGLIEYTKGTHEFHFVFGEQVRQAGIYADIIESISAINTNISRYKSSFKDDSERAKAIDELKENINKLITY